jgi:hypothetical protein
VAQARGDAGLSAVTLESGLGTISFDGQVLEVFGFGEEGSKRIHVGQIQRIGLGEAGPLGGQFIVDVGPAAIGLNMVMRLSDPDRVALEALVAEIRAAGKESA